MQRFRYLTRMGNIVTSTDVDLILKEDNCLLIVNRGSMLSPKPVFARREQGLVIEKEQTVEPSNLPSLLFEYQYLPTYYIGFTKSYISRLQKNMKTIEKEYEDSKSSEEGMYNDFLRDLKRNREKWLLRQANVDKIRESFESNLKNNSISFIEQMKQPTTNNTMDINDIIDNSFANFSNTEEKEDYFDETEFMPIKKIKK